MTTINISADVDKAVKHLHGVSKQIPFAASLAINNTAKKVKEKEGHEIRDVFDRPTPYIQNSIFVKPSNKRNLNAIVGIKDMAIKGNPATKILKAEIGGGSRRLKRYEVLLRSTGNLPSGYYTVPGQAAKIDQYGNIARSQITQILSYFKSFPEAGYKANATDVTKARLAKSTKSRRGFEYFIGKVGDKGTLGIWQRVKSNFGTSIRPVLIYVRSNNYDPIFDFEFVATNTVRKEFANEFDNAINQAVRTAR